MGQGFRPGPARKSNTHPTPTPHPPQLSPTHTHPLFFTFLVIPWPEVKSQSLLITHQDSHQGAFGIGLTFKTMQGERDDLPLLRLTFYVMPQAAQPGLLLSQVY